MVDFSLILLKDPEYGDFQWKVYLIVTRLLILANLLRNVILFVIEGLLPKLKEYFMRFTLQVIISIIRLIGFQTLDRVVCGI